MNRDALLAAIDRPVSADEIRRALQRPIDSEERDETLALVRWFTSRYPTPEARLAYLRQAYARWTRARNGA